MAKFIKSKKRKLNPSESETPTEWKKYILRKYNTLNFETEILENLQTQSIAIANKAIADRKIAKANYEAKVEEVKDDARMQRNEHLARFILRDIIKDFIIDDGTKDYLIQVSEENSSLTKGNNNNGI